MSEEEKKENETVSENVEQKAQESASDSQNADQAEASQETENADKAESANPLSELEAKIEALTKENAELKDQYLRKSADFDNYRKRMIKEKQEAFDYANTSLLQDLLESLDNFDRTVEAAATAADPKTIADGVTMINKALVSMLENKYNLVAYGKPGDAFDPDIHEAIGSSNDPVAEPSLKAVYLKGYKLKDRVIRHAKVMVSMPDGSVKAEETSEQPASEETGEPKAE